MLQSIIRFSLTQRLFVSIITLTIMVLGIKAWLEIPVDAFPDISPTQVKVILKVPGMTAEEIELQVTQPIETEFLGIPKQEMLRSTTKYAITDITLDFQQGTDIYWARQQVNERLLGVLDSLPDNVSGGIAPMSTPLSEMFMFTLEHPSMSLIEKRQLLDWEIRPLLRTVPGVADVNVLGGYAKNYQISVNASLMASLDINLSELEETIRLNNLNMGAGRLIQGNDTLIVRAEGRIDDVQELADLVIKADGTVSQNELDYARQYFVRAYGKDRANATFRTFNEVIKSREVSASRICNYLNARTRYEVRLQILHFLFGIAQADGQISQSEVNVLDTIAGHFRINHQDFESIKAMFIKKADSAYKILEIEKSATNDEVKKAFRTMAKKYHPDKLQHMDEAYRQGAEDKFRMVQEAYETIQKERGM